MPRNFAVPFLALTALAVCAAGASAQTRIRGTVSSISDNAITVHTDAGRDVTVALNGSTHYVTVTKSSLRAITRDTFIGTATKTTGSRLVALEVVVFPNAMRGTGEGHYAWDELPDTTLSGGGNVASTMTNGTVASDTAAGSPGKVGTTMTNGTVSTESGSGGARQLNVTYKGGHKHILVPPTAPVVMLAPGSKSDVSTGDAVFVAEAKGASSPTAGLVALGTDGVKPPM